MHAYGAPLLRLLQSRLYAVDQSSVDKLKASHMDTSIIIQSVALRSAGSLVCC